MQVSGQVSALVGQTCVVSLDPIESHLEEAIDVIYAPPRLPSEKGNDEPPDPLVDGQVDLGALATEFLLLAIDPYPRKPGVQFVPPKAEEGGEHPFAALETLKKRLGARPVVSLGQALSSLRSRLVCYGRACMVAALHRSRMTALPAPPVMPSKSIHAR